MGLTLLRIHFVESGAPRWLSPRTETVHPELLSIQISPINEERSQFCKKKDISISQQYSVIESQW